MLQRLPTSQCGHHFPIGFSSCVMLSNLQHRVQSPQDLGFIIPSPRPWCIGIILSPLSQFTLPCSLQARARLDGPLCGFREVVPEVARHNPTPKRRFQNCVPGGIFGTPPVSGTGPASESAFTWKRPALTSSAFFAIPVDMPDRRRGDVDVPDPPAIGTAVRASGFRVRQPFARHVSAR